MRHLFSIALTFTVLLSCSAQAQVPDSAAYAFRVEAKRGINPGDGSKGYGPYLKYPTRTMAQLPGFGPGKEIKLSKYGGRKDKKAKATGFFRVEKLDGRWWAIDPDGYYFLHNAVNTINMGGSARNKQALQTKFKSEQGWAAGTHQLLLDNGFNGAGSWSDIKTLKNSGLQDKKPLAYTVNWDFMSAYGNKRGGTYQKPGHRGYPQDVIFVFDPEFEAFCDEHAKKIAAYKDDKNVFGYFSDNEMPLGRLNLDNYLKLPPNEPGYQAAKKWLDAKGITAQQITAQHRQEFLYLVAERYFSIVSKAIKKYDPNHMYLGCRFYGAHRDYPELFKAAGQYMDIISMNYYNHWTPSKDHLNNWEAWSGKPFLITEWYVKGEDSGLPNTTGAGWVVKTQEDRGLFYQNFTLGLLESGNCVGWHWFQYQDNDPTKEGAEPSNIDANKGIVDNYYQVYSPLMAKMRELNRSMYALADYFQKQKQ